MEWPYSFGSAREGVQGGQSAGQFEEREGGNHGGNERIGNVPRTSPQGLEYAQ